jgi:hypothetical protein
MVRNRRSAFLTSLKSRLDQDLAERERSSTPPPPRWDAVQPPVDDEDDWAPEASEEPEPSNDDASIRWDEPPPEQVEDNPWLSETADWPPRSEDQAEVRGLSQSSPAEEYPKSPERPPAPYSEPTAENIRRHVADADPLAPASSSGYHAAGDRTARRGENTEAATADMGGHAWAAPVSAWPGSDAVAAPSDQPGAGAEGDPRRRVTSNGDVPGARDVRDAVPIPEVEDFDAIENDRPGPPDSRVAWTESGMSRRLREAIASVRRISVGAWPEAKDQPPERRGLEEAPERPAPWETFEEPAPWEAPQDPEPSTTLDDPASWEALEPPAESYVAKDFVPWRPLGHEPPVPAEGRRGVRIAALVVASATVLIVGSGLGALLAGWHLELPTRAAPTEPATPPAASRTAPPITEVVRLQQPPLPPAPKAAPEAAASGLPLPPPPKPAPWSSVERQDSSPPDAAGNAIDALLRETERSGGSPRTFAAAGPRVLVHYTAGAASGPATVTHLVRQLKAAGFAVEARQVDSPISSPSVRYFFAADRDEAEALGSSLEGQWPGGTAPPVLDFTDFQPKPPPGNLEVWVGS